MISGILIKQNHDIVTAKDEIGISPSLLNFSYKLFVGKYVSGIVLPNIPNFNKSDMTVSGNVHEVPPISSHIGSNLLNILMQ